jgi:hypothetical protein
VAEDGRWQHLAIAASKLDDGAASVSEVLDTALEVFPRSLEPCDDFQAYAVRRLLLALRRALAES